MSRYIVLLLTVAFVSACATPPKGASVVQSADEVPSAQKTFSSELSALEMGMPLAAFQQTFPEAYLAGQSGQTTAFELVNVQKYVTKADILTQNLIWGVGSPQARTQKQVLWFYFVDDRLAKWGNPGDWPEPAEIVLKHETR